MTCKTTCGKTEISLLGCNGEELKAEGYLSPETFEAVEGEPYQVCRRKLVLEDVEVSLPISKAVIDGTTYHAEKVQVCGCTIAATLVGTKLCGGCLGSVWFYDCNQERCEEPAKPQLVARDIRFYTRHIDTITTSEGDVQECYSRHRLYYDSLPECPDHRYLINTCDGRCGHDDIFYRVVSSHDQDFRDKLPYLIVEEFEMQIGEKNEQQE